jgi:uridine kinase
MTSGGGVVVVGVVGPSGSGKTTLAQRLAVLLGADRVIGEDDFWNTALEPGASYADRKGESETPANVNWPALLDAVRRAKRALEQQSPRRRVSIPGADGAPTTRQSLD